MSEIKDNLKYSKSHEWILKDSDCVTVGITDHAQSELSDIVFAELPEVGLELSQGDVLTTIESVKIAADVYSPISGEITQVNENLSDQPELINESPFKKGWICKMKIKGDDSHLMDAQTYRSFIEE